MTDMVQLIANLAIVYIVMVLGIFLGWWVRTQSPTSTEGGRSVLFFTGALELVGILAVVLNWLPMLGVQIPDLLEQVLRAGVWWLVSGAVTYMTVVMIRAWYRNDGPEDVIARYYATRRRR